MICTVMFWEWCYDQWHDSYEDAPTDGSAWLIDENDNDNHDRLLRGGSWDYAPRHCRSAYRYFNIPGSRLSIIGFRLARSSPRTL